ncbi:MAG: VanZ family protein [Solirubrobacteraceae bacterium]
MEVLGRFAPPLALMAVIYALSAQPDLNSGLGWIDLVGRKIVHMVEFGFLWLLWHRALRWRMPWVAAAIAVGYAVSDEIHQRYVSGRVGSPRDVAIDAAGVALAWAVTALICRRRGNLAVQASA